jgi:hypothetical protein
MANKNKKVCYTTIMTKINSIDSQIAHMRDGIAKLKEVLTKNHEEEEEEVCPDVADSEKALIDALQGLCLEGLLEREPEGDA